MTDLAGDHDPEISLIIDEYKRLKKHNENHELLKYLSMVESEYLAHSQNKEVWNEFLDKHDSKKDKIPIPLY